MVGTLAVVALVTTAVCCIKKKKRSERAPKVDTNADYGFYYSTAGYIIYVIDYGSWHILFLGEQLDEGTMEMTDQNPYYGGD